MEGKVATVTTSRRYPMWFSLETKNCSFMKHGLKISDVLCTYFCLRNLELKCSAFCFCFFFFFPQTCCMCVRLLVTLSCCKTPLPSWCHRVHSNSLKWRLQFGFGFVSPFVLKVENKKTDCVLGPLKVLPSGPISAWLTITIDPKLILK